MEYYIGEVIGWKVSYDGTASHVLVFDLHYLKKMIDGVEFDGQMHEWMMLISKHI